VHPVIPRRALLGVLFTCLLAVLPPAAASAAVPAAGSDGAVRFVKVTGPEFDRYTNAPTAPVPSAGTTTTLSRWMDSKFWRSVVYEPYFDDKTSWYDRGWLYKDSYAIYADAPLAGQHPDWILRDAQGNKLYIPWGCSGGTCPQYAADLGDPAYRAWFIAHVKAHVAMGYKGVWLDDVNLDFRIGDGSGAQVAPLDERTGRPMTEDAWRGYVATLTEELRAALPPSVEILHNSIWYAGGTARDAHPAVQREIAAADFINLERGVNDDGLTGGTGPWSLNALLRFVDRVHAKGKAVVFDSLDATPAGRAYNLGAYLLVSEGRDGLGLKAMNPDTWWSQYDVDLGSACGARAAVDGVLRRDFTGGTVLVNEPGAPTRTVALGTTMTDESGSRVASVSLGAKRAAILRGATGCTPSEAPPAPVDPVDPPATSDPGTPTPTPEPAPGGGQPAPGSGPTAPPTPPASGVKHPRLRITSAKPRRTASAAKVRARTVRARKAAVATGAVLISGIAQDLGVDRVTVTLSRRVGTRWVAAGTFRVPLGGATSWALDVTRLVAGRYRAVVSAAKLSDREEFTVVT
jgi:hypothetical protein